MGDRLTDTNTNTKVNSAFHPFGMSGCGYNGAPVLCGWQVILRDPIWQVALRSHPTVFPQPINLVKRTQQQNLVCRFLRKKG